MKINLLGLLLGALLFCAGFEIHGPITNADQVFEMRAEIGALLLTLYLSLGVLGFGFLINNKLKLSPLICGSLFFSALAIIATHLRVLSPGVQPLFIGFILLGYGFLPKKISLEFLKNHFLILLLALAYFIQASVLHFHTDTLMYHFLGPRDWVAQGGYTFPVRWGYVSECSIWEYFLIWPNMIFGARETFGAFDVHLSGQWLMVLFGFLPAALSLSNLAKKWISHPIQVAFISLLSVYVFSVLRTPIWIGKNDWFAIALALTTFEFWMSAKENKSKKTDWIFGVFVGITFVTKYTAVYFLLPLVLFYPLNLRTIVGAILGGFPILLRNWTETGNPFFPLLAEIIPTEWMSYGFIHYQKQFESFQFSLQPEVNIARISHWISDSPWVLMFPLTVFMKPLRSFSLPILVSFIWFMIFHPAGMEDSLKESLRLIGVTALIISLFSLVGLTLLFREQKKLVTLTLALLCIWSYRAFIYLPKIFDQPLNFVERARTDHTGGTIKAWLRAQPNATSLRIFTTGDNQFYYVSYLDIASVMEQPEVNESLIDVHTSKQWVDTLRKFDPDYIVDTRHWSGGPWSVSGSIVQTLILKFPEIVVAQAQGSRVIDFKKLASLLFPFCENETNNAYSLSNVRLSKLKSVW